MEPQWNGGTKVCSNGPGHMTRMADMPIYGKNMKNSFLWNPNVDDLEVCMQYRILEYYEVGSNDDHGLTLTYLWQDQIWSIMLLYGKKLKQWIFKKLLWSMM